MFCVFVKIVKMNQRICIKFSGINGIKCSKTLEIFTVAYSSKKNVNECFKLFQDGRKDANDELRSGRVKNRSKRYKSEENSVVGKFNSFGPFSHGYCTLLMLQLTCHCFFLFFWPSYLID